MRELLLFVPVWLQVAAPGPQGGSRCPGRGRGLGGHPHPGDLDAPPRHPDRRLGHVGHPGVPPGDVQVDGVPGRHGGEGWWRTDPLWTMQGGPMRSRASRVEKQLLLLIF